MQAPRPLSKQKDLTTTQCTSNMPKFHLHNKQDKTKSMNYTPSPQHMCKLAIKLKFKAPQPHNNYTLTLKTTTVKHNIQSRQFN